MKASFWLFLCLLLLSKSVAEAKTPRVLILGDRIYQEPATGAARLLEGRVEIVYRSMAPGEVRNSATALSKLNEWLGEEEWDLIHFNFGLGDLISRAPGMKTFRVLPYHAGGVRATSAGDYEGNLRMLANRLKETGAKLIWASTTPIRHSESNVFRKGSEVEYNKIAAKVMSEAGIPVNDMYSHVVDLIDMEKPASHGVDPFFFDRKPIHPPMVRMILKELDLVRPVKGPVKVFLMIGGWSHIGGGVVVDPKKPRAGSPKGSLDELVLNEKTAGRYQHLLEADGTWATRPDVWVQFDRRGPKSGALGIGYGGDRKRGIGSELGLGHVLGNHFQEQVCVMKTVLGTPSVVTDLASPSGGKPGSGYLSLIQQVRDSLSQMADKFPDYTDQSKYELCGLVLHLGENDPDVVAFEKSLPMLIKDLRKEFSVSDLPVVLVGSGRGGGREPAFPRIREAQKRVALLPEWKGRVVYVETREFWPSGEGRKASRAPSFERWYDNAGSFYEMGVATGEAMIRLLK